MILCEQSTGPVWTSLIISANSESVVINEGKGVEMCSRKSNNTHIHTHAKEFSSKPKKVVLLCNLQM